MRHPSRLPSLRLAIAPALVLVLGGCHAAPMVVAREPAGALAAAPGRPLDVWKDDLPRVEVPYGSRLAIVECTVEFVTLKQVTPSQRQSLGSPVYSPLSAAVDVSGLLHHRAEYPARLRLELPGAAHTVLADLLTSRGLDVLDAHEVAAARAYAVVPGAAAAASTPLLVMDPRGADTGRPRAFDARPAWPLRVLEERPSSLDDVADSALRTELGADLSLRLRLRLGLLEGRPCLEPGSAIEIGRDGTRRRIVADRGAVAPRTVAVPDERHLVSGRTWTIDGDAFQQAVLALLPDFLRDALPDARRGRVLQAAQ